MERKIVAAVVLGSLMAAACHEAHLDGSTPAAFKASVLNMNAEHSVDEAQTLGTLIESAQAAMGEERVRRLLNGKSYGDAKATLESMNGPRPAAPKKG